MPAEVSTINMFYCLDLCALTRSCLFVQFNSLVNSKCIFHLETQQFPSIVAFEFSCVFLTGKSKSSPHVTWLTLWPPQQVCMLCWHCALIHVVEPASTCVSKQNTVTPDGVMTQKIQRGHKAQGQIPLWYSSSATDRSCVPIPAVRPTIIIIALRYEIHISAH